MIQEFDNFIVLTEVWGGKQYLLKDQIRGFGTSDSGSFHIFLEGGNKVETYVDNPESCAEQFISFLEWT